MTSKERTFWDYLNMFQGNPIYKDWMKELREEGNVVIQYQPHDQLKGTEWEKGDPKAVWDSRNRVIEVYSDAPPRGSKSLGEVHMIHASRAAFEITNALQDKEHKFIDELARKGVFSDANEYARAAERLEYDGIWSHHSMMRYGIDRFGWPEGLDIYNRMLNEVWKNDFEKYLEYQKSKGHTEMHVRHYKSLQR